MRGSCSDYLVLVLQTWPAERIEKTSFHQDSTKARVEFTDAIEVSIRSCLSDGKADTRCPPLHLRSRGIDPVLSAISPSGPFLARRRE